MRPRHIQPSLASGALLGRPQNGTITLKTAGAACETDKGAFGNGPCPSWVFRNQGRYDFPVPCFAMLDVKHGMQIEVAPLAIAQRSEEHTSELQSLMRISYAVFCLKKKKQH